MSNKITKEMCEALQKGDSNVFDQIFISYIRNITAFIRGLIKSQAEAEELAHDVMLALWANRTKIDPNQNLNSYLYTSAKNAALRYISKKNSEKAYISNELHVRDNSSNATEEELNAQELQIIIDIKLSTMPAQQRKIFKLSREKGMSNAEIAESLKISKRTVESHLYSAIKELQKSLTLSTDILIIVMLILI